MSEAEGPTWETANGFTARGAPLWRRQLAGAAWAALIGAAVGLPDVGVFTAGARANHEEALRALAVSAGGWVLVALVIRFYIAVGWRVVDELGVDFKTRALSLGQRKLWGRRLRTVQVYDLATVREVSYGSYRGHPLDWFVFKLKDGQKIRFRCSPGVLSMTRRSLQRAGLLDAESWKGKAAQPAVATDVAPRRR